jgi:hypothetical protein
MKLLRMGTGWERFEVGQYNGQDGTGIRLARTRDRIGHV